MNNKSKKGFTLVEIMIVVVIIGLLAAMAIPAFNKVRTTSQTKAITNNLRQIASAADQYFIENGVATLTETDIIGTNLYVKPLTSVAGEDYSLLFNPALPMSFTQLTINTGNGLTVKYPQ